MNPLLATGLMLGVAGSAHCAGMCGPIALAVPLTGKGPWHRLASTLLLNSGRVFTYALLGAAFGMFGNGLRLAGLQQVVSLLAGSLLLLAVLVPGAIERFGAKGRMALVIGRLRSTMAKHLRRSSPEAVFVTGMLNGALPCGMVYAAAIGAAAMGSGTQGALYMLLFGMGTWPALFALRLSGGLLPARARQFLRKASPALIAVTGLLLVLRGAQLGIPYLSPNTPVAATAITACP
jgi:sulfite exporter TauE/SafE